MPTREQLRLMWEAEMEFPELRADYNPFPLKEFTGFTGERIGEIVYDKKNGDLKIIIDESKEYSEGIHSVPNTEGGI